jgi:hypothetical protein
VESHFRAICGEQGSIIEGNLLKIKLLIEGNTGQESCVL